MATALTPAEKARRGLATGAVDRVEGAMVYRVRSASSPGTIYRVVREPGRTLSCDCYAGRHDHDCWHVLACRWLEEREAGATLDARLAAGDRAERERDERLGESRHDLREEDVVDAEIYEDEDE